jgi:hypothetical protein
LVAAKTLDWYPNSDARIHHSNARKVDWDRDWDAEREETVRIILSHDTILHLQIRLEHLGKENRRRVIIFGRRVKALDYATPNTQRATFNSDHADGSGFWLRPNLDTAEKTELSKHLPGPAFPRWDGKHIQLGSDVPYVTLRRFLIALAAIEQIKGAWPAGPLAFALELDGDSAEFVTRDLADLIEIEEGRLQRVRASRRSRCLRLLGEAREHFRSQSRDGRLHCHVCDWSPPVPTHTEIIQIHHLKPLRDYPRSGRRLTLTKALEDLAPLCPNCHRILESRPGGGCYSLGELTEHIRSTNS